MAAKKLNKVNITTKNTIHIVCFSGGESSAIVAIEAVRRFGKENVILLNHDINPKYEDKDIKRFKQEVATYLGLPITYANIKGIYNPEELPSQFQVCIDAGALTDFAGNALCTHRLKTQPFADYLNLNFPVYDSLFEKKKECVIYYGFDENEIDRIQRRTGILGAMSYKTDYILAFWKKRTIFRTLEINIKPPCTYSVFKHANCKGCLKASLLHWYVVYVLYPEIYTEAINMENEIDFTIHTVTRNGIKSPISLTELAPIFMQMNKDGLKATEHQSMKKFAHKIRKYQIDMVETKKPCECIA